MNRIIGIDLGTTFSAVAYMTDEGARLIPNALGDVLTPSVVGIESSGSVLVGRAARELQVIQPDRCVGVFKSGSTTHRVTLDEEGRLVLKPDNQPLYRLAPEQGRRFRLVELEGFAVEFRGEATIIDELIFHQPNGTFTAKRVEGEG